MTKRVPATRITSHAGINALEVDALSVIGALAVAVTLRKWWRQRVSWFRRTLDVRIAGEISSANANSAVRRRFALSVDSTASGQASFHAVSVQADFVVAAFFVHMTLDVLPDDLLALSVCVGVCVRWTDTDHRSERSCVQHATLLF